MIEIVDAGRCTGCNICVRACPTNVFDTVPDRPPRIARLSDCQTCFMCELYCPEDALFVAPQVEATSAGGGGKPVFGQYRWAIGWGREKRSTANEDASYELLVRAH
ncbi:ferredoxin family protein [Paraburkholderia sp. UYCP14C]|uniref:4Fe-4S dicluster domain-containing protein n=1 Tax=Paraburkholderia sp. UYCP14C TaxID=2511130 RepID=UPI00101EB6F4|nr:ferredoxin family protein [Paraburkholderia sp. UYCP14C]RZF27347.1 ferredoxin family protein [Paraburkholderia sp. UYCP14C]